MKVIVAYEHDPADTSPIWLAVTAGDWRPALRDTVDGLKVVWARFPTAERVWIRDQDGERVTPYTTEGQAEDTQPSGLIRVEGG